MYLLPILVTILLSVQCGFAYKILVYSPKFAHSHINFMGSIADTLADAGHNVTTLMPVLDQNMRNGTTKSNIIYLMGSQQSMANHAHLMGQFANLFQTKLFNLPVALVQGKSFARLFSQLCREVIETEGLLDRLKNEHYDVMLTENFDMCGMAMSHYIAPTATCMTSTSVLFGEQFEELGVPKMLSFNPSMITTSLDVHSMISRAWNIIADYIVIELLGPVRQWTDVLFQEKFGPDYPTIQDITSRVAYAFTNAEPLINFASPTLHRVIDVGGMGATPPKQLDEHWLEVLSRRPRTVLISFGSVTQSCQLDHELKRSILKTVANFPQVTFIWKYEQPDNEFSKQESAKVENLVLGKWIPQNDILNDERVVAFVSHAGMGSTQETATRGVPALFIPLYGDQPRNALMMEHNGLAKLFDKHDLHDSTKLTAALGELLNDERYLKRARHVSRMLKNKPFSSRELLIKHVEFAAEFGPSPALRPRSLDMNSIEYYNLDIIFVSLLLVTSILVLTVFLLKKLLTRFVKISKEKKQ